MKVPRMVMPLTEYRDAAGSNFEVALYQATHQDAPRIKVLKTLVGSDKRIEWMDFSIAGALQIEQADGPIQQTWGDGPKIAELSVTQAYDVIKLALGCLPCTAGRFEIVWVPNDGLPF
jgi:hypothetical protein